MTGLTVTDVNIRIAGVNYESPENTDTESRMGETDEQKRS